MSQRVILPEHPLDSPRCGEVPYTEADPEDEDEEEVGSPNRITAPESQKPQPYLVPLLSVFSFQESKRRGPQPHVKCSHSKSFPVYLAVLLSKYIEFASSAFCPPVSPS